MRIPSLATEFCLLLSLSAAPCYAQGGGLFAPGKEYVYDLNILSQAGSSDYVGFASTFNITGELHVTNTGESLSVKIQDMQVSAGDTVQGFLPPTVGKLLPLPNI